MNEVYLNYLDSQAHHNTDMFLFTPLQAVRIHANLMMAYIDTDTGLTNRGLLYNLHENAHLQEATEIDLDVETYTDNFDSIYETNPCLGYFDPVVYDPTSDIYIPDNLELTQAESLEKPNIQILQIAAYQIEFSDTPET